MATTLYFRDTAWGAGEEYGRWSPGTNLTNLSGTATGWTVLRWLPTRGAASSLLQRSTIAGPTQGLEIATGGNPTHWNTAPFTASTCIAGNVTVNLRMAISTTPSNVAPRIVVERIDSQGVVQQTITDSHSGLLINNLNELAYNWTAPVTQTLMHKGERLRCRVVIDDFSSGQAMLSGFTSTFWMEGPTAGGSGDSYITFDTTLPLATAFPPVGSAIYMTDTASDVDPNGATFDAKRAWTSPGTGNLNAVRNSAAGWTAPLQWTTTAGGNFIEWFTPMLQPVTLGGIVKVEHRGLESTGTVNAASRCEIAVCDSNGTNPVAWGVNTTNLEYSGASTNNIYGVAKEDVSITQGKRLRIRFYADDTPTAPMGAGGTITMGYNGTAAGAGFTVLTFPVTLVEFSAGVTVPVAQVTETDETLLPERLQTFPIAQVGEISGASALFIEDLVTGLSATALSATSIALDWDAFPNATGYDVERNGTIIAEFLPPDPSYLDTGLTPETVYSYRVRAVI